MKPAKLSFKPNLVDLSVTGFWFCKSEQRITEIVEDKFQMPCCKLCGSNYVKWNPPIFTPNDPPSNLVESFRCRLDAACNACQAALRAAVQDPDSRNFEALAAAIEGAHLALRDVAEIERRYEPSNVQTT